MSNGDGNGMSEQALNFIAMKKAADKKAAKLKEEQEDDAADSPDPFEIGSVCYHGKGHNRRQVTILEVASAKPLKYSERISIFVAHKPGVLPHGCRLQGGAGEEGGSRGGTGC